MVLRETIRPPRSETPSVFLANRPDDRAAYPRRIRRAAAVTVLAHALAFALAPGITPHPRPQSDTPLDTFTVVDTYNYVAPAEVPRPPDPPSPEPFFSDPVDEPDLPPPPEPAAPHPENPGRVGGVSSPESRAFFAFDSPPRPIHLSAPHYPPLARDAGLEGTVVVRITLDTSGRVVSAQVISSDGTDAMNKEALAAARKSRFTPARQRHVPVRSMVVIPFEFRLN